MSKPEDTPSRDFMQAAGQPNALPEVSLPGDGVQHLQTEDIALPGYTVLGKLGAGGMGLVCSASQASTQRTVAVKIIHGSSVHSAKALSRFQREVEVAARLEHPHIARVYDSGVHEGLYYYAMELIEGRHLDRYVCEQRLSEEAIIRLFLKVCSAISYAHQRGVIHRDLKPSNILVDADGEPHVVDFGLAKAMDVRSDLPPVSLDGELAGTLAYMSPEQAIGHQNDVDAQSDVFALGAVLFELITGELPHDRSGTQFEQQHRIIHEQPRRPRSIKPSIDRDLEAVICKAIAKDKAERYAAVSELSDDLSKYRGGQPVSARPLTAPYFLSKWAKRHSGRILIVSVLLGLVIGSGLSLHHGYVSQRIESQVNADSAAHNRYLNQIVLCRRAIELGHVGRAKALLDSCDTERRGWEWHWLQQNVDHSFMAVRSDTHKSVTPWFDDESGKLLTLDLMGGLNEWSIDTGRKITTRRIHDWRYTTVRMAGMAEPAAIWSHENGLGYWGGRQDSVRAIPEARLHERSLVISPSGQHVAWRSSAHHIQVWQPGADRVRQIHNPEGMDLVAVSSKRSVLAVCTGTELSLLDLNGGEAIARVSFDGSGVSAAEFDADGDRLAVASRSGRIVVFLTDTLQGEWTREAHLGGTRCVAFSRDGSRLATGGGDRIIRVWQTEHGKEVAALRGVTGGVYRLRFSETGEMLVSSQSDGTVMCWEIEHAVQPRRIELPRSPQITSVGFSADGSSYAVGRDDGSMSVNQIGSESNLQIEVGRANLADIAFSSSNEWTCAVSYGGDVVLFNQHGRMVRALRLQSGEQAFSVVFSPDNQHVAVQTLYGLRVYTVPSLDTAMHLPGVNSFAWGRDPGSLLVIREHGSESGQGVLRQLSLGADRDREVCSLPSTYGHIALSPSGHHLAVAMPNQTVTVRELATGNEVAVFHPHGLTSGGLVCEFSADGRRLITAGQTVNLWDVRTGVELLRLPGVAERGSYLDVKYIEKPGGNWIYAADRTGLSMWRDRVDP